MRTLAIVVPYFSANSGGVQKYVYEIASRLKKTYGWRIVIVTTGDKNGKDKKSIEDGFIVYRLGYKFKLSNSPFDFGWLNKINKIFINEKPDIIDIQSPVPGIGNIAAVATKKIPVVVSYHAGSMRKGRLLLDIPIWIYEHFFMQLLLNRANKIITASDFVKYDFLSAYKNNSTTITPGIDTKLFKPNLKIKSKRPGILIVAGQLTKHEQYKGVNTAIEITAKLKSKLPNILLTIVGDGEMRSQYEKKVTDLGLSKNVIFTGRLGGKDLATQYQKANIFLSASTNDNIPTVIIEAMATSLPVVAYGVGAVSTLVEDGKTGYVVQSGDSKKLEQQIYDLLVNKKKASEFGLAGMIKAKENFDWELKAEETDLVLNTVINKKIIQLSSYYPPHMGGMEIVIQEVSKELARNKYDVNIITSNIGAKDVPVIESDQNLEINRLESIEFAHTPVMWALPSKLISLPSDSILHVHVAQILVPEISLVIAKIRGFKIVSHFHLDVEPSGLLGFMFILYKKYILGIVLRNSDKVIVFSDVQKKLIKDKYGVNLGKIAIVPNGVGSQFFIRRNKVFSKNKLKLLYVGRLTNQKRVDRIIEAMSLIKSKAQLTIVGDGEDSDKLQSQTKKLNLKNILFVGRKSGEELLKYYKDADAFIISSDKEGMPLVVLEAMAEGLPIVASDVIGLHELVNGVGVLVKDPNPENFANAIDKLWQNLAQLKILSDKSLEKAREYSWSRVVDKIERIYANI